MLPMERLRLLWSLSFLCISSCEPHSSEHCPQIISLRLYIEETHPFHIRYFYYAHTVSNRFHSTNCILTNPVLFPQTYPFCLIFFIVYSLEYLLSGSSCLYTSLLSFSSPRLDSMVDRVNSDINKIYLCDFFHFTFHCLSHCINNTDW